MPETYEEETKRLIENRKRNAEIRRTQQIKQRNTLLMGIGGVAVVILLIIIICISCSLGKNKEQPTIQTQTTTVEETTTTANEETTTVTSMYTTDALNLRKRATTKSDIITTIGAGKRVEILSEEGKWCKVQRGKDTGYVMKKYLSYEKALD